MENQPHTQYKIITGFKEIAKKYNKELEFPLLVDDSKTVVTAVRFKDNKQKLITLPHYIISRSETDEQFYQEGLKFFEEIILTKLN